MAAKYPDNSNQHHSQRYFDVFQEPCRMLMPIQGYEKKPLVSIEEAVDPLVPLVPDVKRMAYVAKMKCEKSPANNLSLDESASIILYTMEWEPQEECLYYVLNATLRAEDRKQLVPWFLYLKLLLTGLARLPSLHRIVYRGVRGDIRKNYSKGETIIWWGFSSCTTTMDVLEKQQFLGLSGIRTLFTIECYSGKDIRQHSSLTSEDEVLLPPGRQFKIVSCLVQSGDLCIIQLRETEPPYPLLEPIQTPLTTTSINSLSLNKQMNK